MIRALGLFVVAACSSRTPVKEEPPRGSDAIVPVTSEAATVTIDAAPTATVPAMADVTFEKPAGPMAPRDAKLAFTVENRGDAPVTLNRDMLESAIFAIEVSDASGKRRYTIPPGVPPASYQPRMETLAPGQKWRIEVELNVFSPELEAGTYTAVVKASPQLSSSAVTFQIR